MKKLLAVIFSALMLTFALLTGCGEDTKDETKKDDKAPQTEQDENTESTDEKSDVYTYDELLDRVEKIAPKVAADNNILVTVDDLKFSEAAVRYAVLYSNMYLTTPEDISNSINEFFVLNAAIVKEAEKLGLGVDEDTFKQNIEAMQVYFKQAFGDEYEAQVEAEGFTPFYLYLNQCYNLYFNDVLNSYVEDESTDFNAQVLAQAYEEALPVLLENEYVRAKHILIQFPADAEKDEDGNVIESAKTATKAMAEKVLAEVKAISDPSEFDALIEKYNEDPGMTNYPEGYYFTKGMMVEAFEASTYALEEYQTSGLVETPYGYHIIQKLPFDVETIAKSSLVSDQTFSQYYNAIATDKLTAILMENAASYKAEYLDGFDAAVEKYTEEYHNVWETPAEETTEE